MLCAYSSVDATSLFHWRGAENKILRIKNSINVFQVFLKIYCQLEVDDKPVGEYLPLGMHEHTHRLTDSPQT